MDDEAKQAMAIFRFGVIADLVGRKLSRGEKERLLKEKVSYHWEIPRSGRSYVSRSTIISWLRAYERSGRRLESLYPRDRADKGKARALDEETASALLALKRERPALSLPVLMKEARKRGILKERPRVSYGCVYRLFKQHGVEQEAPPQDRRRFEAELPNDLWQSDALHGPKVLVEGRLRKSYLFAFIDDMSRIIPHAEFYLHERLPSYLDALAKALAKRGLPRKLYLDNASAFRSQLLQHACASLGIALIHSKPYQPEGRGKIERLNGKSAVMVRRPRQRPCCRGLRIMSSTLQLEALEEPEQCVTGLEENVLGVRRLQFLQHPLLHGQVGAEVPVGRYGALMAEPEGNDADIQSRLEQMDGGCVPH